ncbi:MAG TPA: zf-HC2 domain-containing protein [Motilibacteraceae bacterium]|nr:zf-HC2 domain-containing protein [Motilibacteraceae bacterium]
MTCAEVRLSLGAHVLGALEPAERADVEAHLAACPGCREELAELAVLPGLMSRVDLSDLDLSADESDVSSETSAEHVLDAVLFQVARERRAARRRRAVLTTVGLVAAAAVAAVLALVVPGRAPSAPPAPVAAARTVAADGPGGVHFTADLAPRGWGTEVVLHLSGVPRGQWCQLVAVGRDGRTEIAASWVASYAGRADVTGATSVPLASLAALRITTDQGTIASAAVPS